MDGFRAFRIDQKNDQIVAGFCDLRVDDLSPGEVLIKVSHSTINYKDALAATGTGRILRTFPLVGGIDLAGTVVSSDDERCICSYQKLEGSHASKIYYFIDRRTRTACCPSLGKFGGGAGHIHH